MMRFDAMSWLERNARRAAEIAGVIARSGDVESDDE